MKKGKLLFVLLSLLLTSCSKKPLVSSSLNPISIYETKEETTKEIVEVVVKEYNPTYSSLIEMISDVRQSVVDIKTLISPQSSSAGSGVIVGKSDDGYYVITNHHVIDNGRSFSITTHDESGGVSYEAMLIGGSPKSDIAVLKIVTSDNLKVASFVDDSTKVKVGTSVIAIGNPLGILGGTVTKGIISATAREVYVGDIGYMRLLQTDAAINSGNSGGALFNEEGLLVGIVNSGYSSYEGLNFAIPGNDAKKALESIISTFHTIGDNLGYVRNETKVGINLNETQIYSDSSLNSKMNIIYVESVEDNSDGAKNNIPSYQDVYNGKSNYFYAVSKIDGENVSSLSNAQNKLSELNVDDEVTFTFKKVMYTRVSSFFGAQTAFYLDDNDVEVKMTISQFIYSIE